MGGMKRFVLALIVVPLAVGTAAFVPGARAQGPPSPLLDCANWRYGAADEPAPGVLPAEFDRTNYKRTSLRDPNPSIVNSPQNHCGQMGMAVDLAWGVQKGRPDVTIAVLDSGIKWRDAFAMHDLANKAYLNVGEVVPPCGAVQPDCNHDGRVTIAELITGVDIVLGERPAKD